MSSYSPGQPFQEVSSSPVRPLGDPRKGPEAYLDLAERQNLTRMLSYPEDLPPKFKAWLLDYIAVNAHGIPASAITGSDRDSVSTRLTRSSNQGGFTGGVTANIIWTVVEWDPAALFNSATPTRVTVSRPGKYLVTLQVEFLVATGQLEIWKNGATRQAIGPSPVGSIGTVLNLAKDDFVEAKVVPSSSTTVVHYEGNHTPVLTVTRVSA